MHRRRMEDDWLTYLPSLSKHVRTFEMTGNLPCMRWRMILCPNSWFAQDSRLIYPLARKSCFWGTGRQKSGVPHPAKDENGLQDMMPCVITPVFKTAATCPILKCTACKLGPTGLSKQLATNKKAGILSASQYQPRDLMSMDQFTSGSPGWLFMGYNCVLYSMMLHPGLLLKHEVSLGACEMVCSKECFKEWLYDLCCSKVKRYHSNNVVFTAAEFCSGCDSKHQQHSFSGIWFKPSCQWHECSWSMWPFTGMNNQVTPKMWPLAVCHTMWLHNHLPNGVTCLSPIDLLTLASAPIIVICSALMFGAVQFMYLTPNFRKGRKFWNGRACAPGQIPWLLDEPSPWLCVTSLRVCEAPVPCCFWKSFSHCLLRWKGKLNH